MRTYSRTTAVAVAALLALTGCNRGDRKAAPSPSAPVTTSTGGTTTTASPATSESPAAGLDAVVRRFGKKLDWDGCGGGFDCAKLTVPLDYAKPDGDTIQLAVIRLKAARKDRRIGSVVLNPGGPGGSGIEFARQAQVLLPQEVRDRFDTVSFDPRGVGESAPVDCIGDRQLDALLAVDPDPDNATERDALFRANRDFANACKNGPSAKLLPHISTVDTARDLDVLRAALGDEKLTYVGFSYGTLLGARYAEQFPTHIRALVLDGALDPSLSTTQITLAQAEGFERALKVFLADCAREGCAFASHGGADAAYDELMRRIERAPLSASGYPGRKLGPGEALFGVAAALYSREYGWPLLRTALEDAYTKGDATGLFQLFDNLVERNAAGHYSNSVEAQAAINCVDGDYSSNQESYERDATFFAKKAPRFGRALAFGPVVCASWPVKPVSHAGPIHVTGAPPIVVVGTTRDPATPYAWSVALAKQLPGVLLTHEGDGHTAYGYGRSSCVDEAVDAYLIDLTVPKPGTRCD